MDLNNIHEDWKKDAPNLAAMKAANPFTIPENYFIDLQENTLVRITIESIAGGDKGGAFTVPEGYFENLNEEINAAVRLAELKEKTSAENFIVPQNYFNDLNEKITARIKLEEFLLQEAESVSDFSVPEGYFEKLQQSILAKTTEEAEIKPVKVRKLSVGWMRYAAAACITAMIGTGIFLNYSNREDADIEASLANIPQHEIVNYLQVNSTITDAEIVAEHLEQDGIKPEVDAEFSKKEIEQYLETSL